MSSLAASFSELTRQLASGELTAVELARQSLDQITRCDGDVKAFLHVDREGTLAQAAEVDRRRAAGTPLGPLAGIPIAIKDVICVAGQTTTCASQMLRNFVPPYDAHVISKLRAADAVLVGKVNMDEFAMGSSTENSSYQKTANPWDLQRTPGGSSGGSAAAVAARMTPLALGSDTGGSIRQPAGLCGIVGLKPTYGRVSRYGLVAYASSLDQIGPMATDVAGTAALLEAIAGHDPRDSTSVPCDVPRYTTTLEQPLAGLKIGIAREHFGAGLDPEVEQGVRSAIDVYRSLGATVHEISLPHQKYAVAVYYIVAPSEASSNLARYDGVHYGHRASQFDGLVDMYSSSRGEGFGAEVKRRIMLGTYALSAGYADQYYNKALKVRRLIRNDFEKAFAEVDFLIGPTTPTPAFRLGEKAANPLAMYLSDIYTITTNLAGIPGLSMPCGLSSEGLPIGVQLVGPALSETALLQAARLYERETDWHTRRPNLTV